MASPNEDLLARKNMPKPVFETPLLISGLVLTLTSTRRLRPKRVGAEVVRSSKSISGKNSPGHRI